VADTIGERLPRQGQFIGPVDPEKAEDREADQPINGGKNSGCWWDTESGLDRVADGVADRTQRLAAIGDGQVPLCAAMAFCLLAGIKPPRVGGDVSDE